MLVYKLTGRHERLELRCSWKRRVARIADDVMQVHVVSRSHTRVHDLVLQHTLYRRFTPLHDYVVRVLLVSLEATNTLSLLSFVFVQ